jgi:hypothetical protein
MNARANLAQKDRAIVDQDEHEERRTYCRHGNMLPD